MKFIPHDYQRYCINRVISDNALGLLLDMGLGKTIITLTAINDLRYNRFAIGKTLVIAPKKVAEDTWTREKDKWDHLKLLRIMPVLGSENKRIKALNTPADIYVINRENVQWLVEYYRNSWCFDMVVIDELSSFKNPQAKRFKALKLVKPHIKRIIGLTGTPAPNGLIDLWAHRERYFEPDQRNRDTIFSYAPKNDSDNTIRQKIGDICISLSAKDYLKLPERIDNPVYVQLDDKAKALYEKMEKDMLIQVNEDTIDAASAAVLSNKLLQMCNGAIYDENKNVIEIHDSKIEAFKELVEAANGKSMLVFYNFKHDLDRIKKALVKSGLRVGELKTPEDISSWNNGNIDILLAHPASAAYGLNLQAGGNIIVWFGLTWSLELYQQANARLHRQGQDQVVIIHHLIVDTGIDKMVMEALEGKRATQDMLLEALKAKIKEYKEIKI
jgi:SNF2 family DNA or RNA helicase